MLAIAGHEGALNEIETSRLEGVINFENLKVKMLIQHLELM